MQRRGWLCHCSDIGVYHSILESAYTPNEFVVISHVWFREVLSAVKLGSQEVPLLPRWRDTGEVGGTCSLSSTHNTPERPEIDSNIL